MTRKLNNKGFTLIELMVVIVIIGVLATLAIPRFTEASARAKVAEAPRVLASYESAFLAAAAETPVADITPGHLIFTVPTSQWFVYAMVSVTGTDPTTPAGDDVKGGAIRCIAGVKNGTANSGNIGSFPGDGVIGSTYEESRNGGAGGFDRARVAGDNTKVTNAMTRMIPNFKPDPAPAAAGN
jgi:prepilin-type N-terminal cleavage/methylation domain-containing protein